MFTQVSTVQDIKSSDGGGTMVSNERTQASGWIWDEEDDQVYSLSRRVTHATGRRLIGMYHKPVKEKQLRSKLSQTQLVMMHSEICLQNNKYIENYVSDETSLSISVPQVSLLTEHSCLMTMNL